MVALSSGISETEKNKQAEVKEPLTTKKILETIRLVTTLISVIFGLVGVSRESFCLSITTGVMMILETVATFFSEFDASTIVSMVFNILIALTTFAFAYMCKVGMNVFNTAQIEPIMVARNRTASKCPSVVVNFTDNKSISSDPPHTATTTDEPNIVQPLADSPLDQSSPVESTILQISAPTPPEIIPEEPTVKIPNEPTELIPGEPITTTQEEPAENITDEANMEKSDSSKYEMTPLDSVEPVIKRESSTSAEVVTE